MLGLLRSKRHDLRQQSTPTTAAPEATIEAGSPQRAGLQSKASGLRSAQARQLTCCLTDRLYCRVVPAGSSPFVLSLQRTHMFKPYTSSRSNFCRASISSLQGAGCISQAFARSGLCNAKIQQAHGMRGTLSCRSVQADLVVNTRGRFHCLSSLQ